MKRSIQVFLTLGLLVVALAHAFPAQAQLNVGPTAAAIGGAGIAAVDPAEASFLNPASLAHVRRFYIGGIYGFGDLGASRSYNQMGVHVADGTPGVLIPGALSYMRNRIDLEGGDTNLQQDLQLGFGGFVFSQASLGLAVHRRIDRLASGPEYTQMNLHAGLLVTPFEWLGLAFAAYDILPADQTVPQDYRVQPVFGLGFNVVPHEILRLRLDLVRPDRFNEGRKTNIKAGLETIFTQYWGARVGGFWEETASQTFVTAGLGYRGPRLSFDYAVQREVRSADLTRHMFDLWLPF